ncbi:MAG: flippase [Thermodesulfobacteriota bacterium]|nr:flippase [Thermodesulfobacteriota bacterium]
MKKKEIDKRGIFEVRKIGKNSFFLLMSRVLGISVTLGIIVIVARYLGVESFGFYALVVAISMAIRPLTDFGFDRIICREISKKKYIADRYLGTTIATKVVFSIVLLTVAGLMVILFSSWNHDIKLAVIIAITTEFAMSMGQTYLSVIRAFERMEFEFIATIIHRLTTFVFVVIVVLYDLGFTAIFYARFLSSIVYLLICAILLYGKFVRPRFHFNLPLTKYIIRESFPLAISSLLITLIFKVDVFLLKWFGNETDIALFEAPHRLITQMQIFAVSISSALFPVMSRNANGPLNELLYQYYRKAYKFLLITGAFASTFFYIGGKPLITMIFGSDFAHASISLKILSPTVCFLFLSSLQSLFIIAIGRQFLNTICIATALMINIVLDVLLIPDYSYIGASIATLISYFIIVAMNSYFINTQGVKTNILGIVTKTAIAVLITSSAIFMSFPNNIITLILRLCIGLLLYLLSMHLLRVLSQEEISIIKNVFYKNRQDISPENKEMAEF